MGIGRWVKLGMLVLAMVTLNAVRCPAAPSPNLIERAKNGDCNVQSYLGHLYLAGKGVEQDFVKARYWYQRVIDQPGADAKIVAHANLVMGILYNSGKGGEQDSTTALHCLETAAGQGYTDAHITIGLMYAKGLGVKKDYNKALYWWKLAEEKGHPTAAEYVRELMEMMASHG